MLANHNIILSRGTISPSQFVDGLRSVTGVNTVAGGTHQHGIPIQSTSAYPTDHPIYTNKLPLGVLTDKTTNVVVGDTGTNRFNTGNGQMNWKGFVVTHAAPRKITVKYDDTNHTQQWSLRKNDQWVPVGVKPSDNFNYIRFGPRFNGAEAGIF